MFTDALVSCSARRAAFNGDVTAVDTVLDALPRERWTELDSVGTTALHVAVLRSQAPSVQRLLQRGFPVDAKSAAGWSAVHYSILQRDQSLTRVLHAAQVRAAEHAYRQRKPQLLAELATLPDFRGSLRWEFCSPVFAPLLRRFAPHDTYTVTKRGACLRIDGTLKGLIDEHGAEAPSLIPQWDRGAFSLLFDGQSVADAGKTGAALPTDGARHLALWLVDRDKGEVVDALPPNEARTDDELREEADHLLVNGALKSKLRAREFSFAPARNWRGAPRREVAEGWNSVVYETKGKLEAQTIEAGAARRDRCRGTFEQYLASDASGGDKTHVVHDLVAIADGVPEEGVEGGDDGDGGVADEEEDDTHAENEDEIAEAVATPAAAAEFGLPSTPPQEGSTVEQPAPPSAQKPPAALPAGRKVPKPRAFKGTVWMAEGHPLSVRALFPLLDVCASVNKHFAKVRRFLAKWADVDACPVRLQVPLFMTVYAQVAFCNFELLKPEDAAALPADFFKPPPEFRVVTLDEKLDAMEARLAEDARRNPNRSADADAEETEKHGDDEEEDVPEGMHQAASAE